MSKLDGFPALLRWYEDQAAHWANRAASPEALAWRTCEAMSVHGVDGVKRWLQEFDRFFRESSAPLQDFLAVEAIFQRHEAALLDVIGGFGETAVRQGQGDAFFQSMRGGADATGLVVLRFLSAWTALNANRLEACATECEKVDEPFAAIYTIHGQALVDLKRLDEAVDVLAVAVKLSPGEILAWFQLAKAQHALGRRAEAWAALAECKRLVPSSDEIALFMGLVALDAPPDVEKAHVAWHALRPHLAQHAGNGVVTSVLLRLAGALGDKEKVRGLLAEIDWATIQRDNALTREMAMVLRMFQERGWMELASEFLRRVVPDGDA